MLHSLEWATAGIGLYVNVDKTEYMCFKQRGDISLLNESSLKLVDKFTYIGSSVSSIEVDSNTRLAKPWTAIDRISIIWSSDMTDKIKRCFFQGPVVSILLYGCTTWMLTKRMEKKLDSNHTKMLRATLNMSWKQHLQNRSCTATYHPARKLSKLDEQDMRDTAGKVRTSSKAIYLCGPLHMDEERHGNKLESIYSSSVPIQDVALKTSCER